MAWFSLFNNKTVWNSVTQMTVWIWCFLYVLLHVTLGFKFLKQCNTGSRFSHQPAVSHNAIVIGASLHEENEGLLVRLDFHLNVYITFCIKNSLIYRCVCKCVNVSYWMSSYYCSVFCVFWSILKAELRDVDGKSLLTEDCVKLEDKIWGQN